MAASVAVATVAVVSLVFALISRGRATTEVRDGRTMRRWSRNRACWPPRARPSCRSIPSARSCWRWPRCAPLPRTRRCSRFARRSISRRCAFGCQALDRRGPSRVRRSRTAGRRPTDRGIGERDRHGLRHLERPRPATHRVRGLRSDRGLEPDGSRIAVEEGCSMTIRDATTYELLLRQMDQCSGPGTATRSVLTGRRSTTRTTSASCAGI